MQVNKCTEIKCILQHIFSHLNIMYFTGGVRGVRPMINGQSSIETLPFSLIQIIQSTKDRETG